MKRNILLNAFWNVIVVCLLLLVIYIISISVIAKNQGLNIKGTVYKTGDDANYSLSDKDESKESPCGSLILTGNCAVSSNKIPGFETYNAIGNLDNDPITFSYTFPSSLLEVNENEWQMADDFLKSIGDVGLKGKIKYGVIVFQSSFDGETWITDNEITNLFSKNSKNTIEYKVNSNQLLNGCYYRVLVAYRMTKVISTGAFGKKDYQYKRIAEAYRFYICNEQENKNAVKPKPERTYSFNAEPVNTGMNNGYSGKKPLTANDPHYPWRIGKFYVSGYSGNPLPDKIDGPTFLKNVGDKVVLWFELSQKNINALNGDENLSINVDENGSDQYFATPVQNFKRGALIIRFTDYQNNQTTNTYVDYLSAASTTTADTKVQVFEEGDYEVALDYEVRNLAKVFPWEQLTSYRIFFKFSVRNSNCMVYPIDLETGNELKDNSFTEKGFRLDLAQSRYLDISIKRGTLNKNDLDLRVSQIASDLEEFTDEGVYEITVKNQYDQNGNGVVTKTIYVGSNNLLKAYVKEKPNYSIADLVKLEEQGAVFQDDGSILLPDGEQETAVDHENEDNNVTTSGETGATSDQMEVEDEEEEPNKAKKILDILFSR